MTHPPTGPDTPTPPTGPSRAADMTWLQRRDALARWNAAVEEQRATDSLREHARLRMPVHEEKARLHTARQAWDAVRGAS